VTVRVGSAVGAAVDGALAAAGGVEGEGIAGEAGIELEQPATTSSVRKVAARCLGMVASIVRPAGLGPIVQAGRHVIDGQGGSGSARR
jgi:hypothetical protein